MIEINNRKISKDCEPYIIAELSANHNGSLKNAKDSIKAAKKSGADAIKIQTYKAETMTINCDKKDFIIKGGLWNGYKLYDLYEEAHTPYEWHQELFSYSKELGITIFSSPFDETAVDLLDELDTPAYKIASFEICDIPLIEYVAKKNKPILMSTGMASINEITEAVTAAKDNGCENLLLFHCISAYPAPIEQANLKNLIYLREKFDLEVGLSDHTNGNTAAIASIALGASAIEKHFILDRKNKGPDSEFSIEPNELRELKDLSRKAWEALGSSVFERSKDEIKSKVFRRSLYFVEPLKKGAIITSENIRRIRPGYGLPPKYENTIIGMKLIQDVERGDPVCWDVLDN